MWNVYSILKTSSFFHFLEMMLFGSCKIFTQNSDVSQNYRNISIGKNDDSATFII